MCGRGGWVGRVYLLALYILSPQTNVMEGLNVIYTGSPGYACTCARTKFDPAHANSTHMRTCALIWAAAVSTEVHFFEASADYDYTLMLSSSSFFFFAASFSSIYYSNVLVRQHGDITLAVKKEAA